MTLPTTHNARSTPTAPRTFWRDWLWWLPVSALALTLALIFIDPFAGDWDSLDYTVLALRAQPSSMLFGRMLFIFSNHLLFKAAHALSGLQPENAYLLFKYAVVAQSPVAVAVWWLLTRDLTNSTRVATVAALLLALSPFYVVYSGQAMTEIPSVLLLGVSLVIHLRGVRRRSVWMVLLGAFLLGAGVNLREGVALYGLWLVTAPFVCGWRFKARELFVIALSCLIFFAIAVGPFAYYYFGDIDGYRQAWWGWVESSRMESALHPVSFGNFRILLLWFFVASPLVVVALPFAFFSEWRRRGLSLTFVLAAIGLFANLTLIVHYSTVINGRYLLTGLPALLPLVADFLLRIGRPVMDRLRRAGEAPDDDDRRAFVPVVVLIALVAVWIGIKAYAGAWSTIQSHGLTKEYRERLALLPQDAVVMAGGQTVSVSFWRGVGAGNWEWIGTGGGWPGEKLVPTIDDYLKRGRRVFLDTDPELWSPKGWQLEETRAIVGLQSRFSYRRVSDTIYEIRPPGDPTARDQPNLERLLPENRRR